MAAANNYDILVIMTEQHDLSQIHRIVADRKVDGIIISRSETDAHVQKFLLEKKVPFVVIGRSELPEVCWVDNCNEEASKELTGLMLMKGMRKLALLGGNRSYLVTESRKAGFLEAHKEQDIEADESLIFYDVDNYPKTMKAVEQALEAEADGILCMDDSITNMTIGCLREKGIRVPSQMKIASFYDSPQLEANAPSITSLQFNTKDLGKNACLNLLKQLGENIQQDQYTLNYQVILRESTK